MKAIIYKSYGTPNVLKLKTIDKPKPKANEVLVKIYATSVTSGDVRLRSSDFPALFWLPARLIFGLFKPKKTILGHEFSGIIEEIGSSVTRFKIGDKVMGTTTMLNTGSYAEYVCVPEQWKHGVITSKPANLSFYDSALLPIGGMTATFLLEKANLASNQNVLIYGASGSVGSYAVQIAKYKNATVTTVSSASNFSMLKSLGADYCIDYTIENYFDKNEKYDIIFDAVGKTSKSKAKKVLKDYAKYVSVNMLTKEKLENLEFVKQLAEENKLMPYVDRTFTLEELVSAHEYVDTGRKRGNVLIKVVS